MSEKKPIRTIVDKENGDVVGFACGNCGTFYSTIAGEDKARRNAERCHNSIRTCEKCGAEVKADRRKCESCDRAENDEFRENSAKKELARFEKAPKVKLADYKGEYLWFPGSMIGNDGFLRSDEVEDDFEDDEMPEYAWACGSFGLRMDADSIIENALDNHHEDAGENVGDEDRKELQAILDAWCAKQRVTSYEPIDEVVLLR